MSFLSGDYEHSEEFRPQFAESPKEEIECEVYHCHTPRLPNSECCYLHQEEAAELEMRA